MSKEKIAQNKIETITQYTHRLQNGNVDSKGYKSVETTYDKQGNSIEVVNYKPNGTVSSRHLYKYNDKDQKIEYQQFQDLPGKGFALAFRQAFTYDPKGNKLTEIGYDGRTTYRIAYTYTADGKQKDITKYTANSPRWHQEIASIIHHPGRSPTIIPIASKFFAVLRQVNVIASPNAL